MRITKEREMNDEVSRLRVEIERRERDIQKTTSTLTAKEVELKGLYEEFEKFR